MRYYILSITKREVTDRNQICKNKKQKQNKTKKLSDKTNKKSFDVTVQNSRHARID